MIDIIYYHKERMLYLECQSMRAKKLARRIHKLEAAYLEDAEDIKNYKEFLSVALCDNMILKDIGFLR